MPITQILFILVWVVMSSLNLEFSSPFKEKIATHDLPKIYSMHLYSDISRSIFRRCSLLITKPTLQEYVNFWKCYSFGAS
jgi:hypothetical protein